MKRHIILFSLFFPTLICTSNLYAAEASTAVYNDEKFEFSATDLENIASYEEKAQKWVQELKDFRINLLEALEDEAEKALINQFFSDEAIAQYFEVNMQWYKIKWVYRDRIKSVNIPEATATTIRDELKGIVCNKETTLVVYGQEIKVASVELTKDNAPQLDKLATQLAELYQIKKPQIYLVEGEGMLSNVAVNAESVFLLKKDLKTDDKISYNLAHEFAHCYFKTTNDNNNLLTSFINKLNKKPSLETIAFFLHAIESLTDMKAVEILKTPLGMLRDYLSHLDEFPYQAHPSSFNRACFAYHKAKKCGLL